MPILYIIVRVLFFGRRENGGAGCTVGMWVYAGGSIRTRARKCVGQEAGTSSGVTCFRALIYRRRRSQQKKHTQLLSVIHSNEHDTFFFGCTFGCSNTSSILHVRVHFYSAFVWQGEGEEEYFIFSLIHPLLQLFLNIHSVFLKTTIGRHHLQSAKTTVLTYREVQLLSRAGGFAIVICHLIQRRPVCGSGLLELNHLTWLLSLHHTWLCQSSL